MRAACLAILAVLAVQPAAAVHAADYQGAAAAIRQFSEVTKPGNATDPNAVLRAELTAFRERAAKLPPDEAARGWLALVDHFLATDPNAQIRNRVEQGPVDYQEVLRSLPPPAAWSRLQTLVEERAAKSQRKDPFDFTLLLTVHLLQGDTQQAWADLTALRPLTGQPGLRQMNALETLSGVAEALTESSTDPARVLQVLEMQLTLPSQPRSGRRIQVPDLVRMAGQARAEAFLRRALVADVNLTVPEHTATRTLAQRLALELLPKLKVPQWSLAQSLDGSALYLALERRFPASAAPKQPQGGGMRGFFGEPDDGGRSAARAYYVMSLVAAGKVDQAVPMAPVFRRNSVRLGYHGGLMEQVLLGGKERELFQFFRQALDRWPDLPLWDEFGQVAEATRRGGEVVTQIRTLLQRKTITQATANTMRAQLTTQLLSLGKTDEAVAVIREQLRNAGPNSGADAVTLGMQLARVGLLEKNDLWTSEGFRAAIADIEGNENSSSYRSSELVDLLQEAGRGPEAERLLISIIGRSLKNQEQSPLIEAAPLVQLAEVYHRAGRHADVLTLLTKESHWPARDLSELMMMTAGGDLPLGYMAAAALVKEGRRAEAVEILHAVLLRRPNLDPAYELLANEEGTRALPFLEALFKRDPFEERPLIWKAYILHRAGRQEEAEEAARAAITIDPSDGEMHHGRRMRVYAVLADIREARGDAAQAKFFRGVIEAIRLAEQADKLREAGLMQRATKVYDESLTHFADAYCIQSRLAVQLAKQGRLQEAEAHFKRAFELMPSSFGRVETHCLGCEGVLTSREAQAIADKVLTELARRTPEKAQVHYLLGLLREAQNRPADAMPFFQAAVQRDPDYLNAWKHIEALQRQGISVANPDAVTLALVRLDPLSLHQSSWERAPVSFRALWTALEAARESRPELLHRSLLPLPASARRLETLEQTHPELKAELQQGNWRRYSRGFDDEDKNVKHPADAIAEARVIVSASRLADLFRVAKKQEVQ